MTTPGISATPSDAPGATQRPTGVTVLAILAFIAAGFSVLAGIAMLAAGSLFGAALGSFGAGLGAAIGGLLGILMLLLAALYATVGWGFWTGQTWAWLLGLILTGISGASQLMSLVRGEYSTLIGLAISGFIIWYLLQPGVKRYFGKA